VKKKKFVFWKTTNQKISNICLFIAAGFFFANRVWTIPLGGHLQLLFAFISLITHDFIYSKLKNIFIQSKMMLKEIDKLDLKIK